MATDISLIIKNLNAFYDFRGKTIIHIGAGGGQFIEYARKAKKVIAVDNDSVAIESLNESIRKMQMEHIYTVVLADFYKIDLRGDVLFFEFCLHEMIDPCKALDKAKQSAHDIVIIDHSHGSEWPYYTNEIEKIKKSWAAAESMGLKKKETFAAIQSFNDYEELYNKVKSQGEIPISRIAKFKGQKLIAIPMTYTIGVGPSH